MAQDLHPAKSILLCQRCRSEFVPTCTNNPRVLAIQLRLNDVPLQVDVQRHVEYLQDEERELQRYDDEITRLRLALGQLEAQRDVLKRNKEERQSLLAPIRKIPRELLDEIFSYVCLSKYGCALEICRQYSGERQISAPAFSLSCVSHYWRTVVTSRPHLWSTISVDVSELNRDVRQLTEVYLRNSLDHSLDVIIHGSGNPGCQGKHGRAIIELLLPHHHRFEYLEVESDTLITSATDQTFSFPSLSALYVHFGGYNDAQTFWNAIRKAPSLVDVESEVLDPSMFPCHQLTTLKIGACEGDELFDILRSCPRLESLEFRELFPNSTRRPQHINLPFLRRLSATADCREEPSDSCHSILFDHLTLPSLVSISIQDYFQDGVDGQRETWAPTSFVGMLQRSECKLRSLQLLLCYHYLPFPEFPGMLELCPELTNLNIEMSDREGSHFTYDFLRALLPQPSDQSQSPLLPKLESLVITEWQMNAIDSQTASSLFDMIEARAMKLSTPWDIHLQFEDEPESVVEMKKALEVRRQKLQAIGTTCHIAG